MADDNRPTPVPNNYTNNSKAKAAEGAESLSKITRPIAKSIERKPSLGAKLRQNFAGDDAQTVGQYLLFDVVIPATKNLIFNMLTEGGRRLLFGGGGPVSSFVSTGGENRTAYSGMYRATAATGAPTGSDPRREIGPGNVSRPIQAYREILVETRTDAELVLDGLGTLIDEYDRASVADLYTAVGISATHTDTTIGWFSLAGVKMNPVPEGTLLIFPRAVSLNR